ncbi:MAG: VCBS repeat-containing protein [Candidatus Cloacimonetes bacterium]|nr:VCBS repeat-containing protein [Candidatus Cloacimonadota bacterium]
MKNRSTIIFSIIVTTLTLLLSGCGGGGGGGEGGVGTSTTVNSPGTPNTPTNNTPPINNDLSIGDFSGSVSFPSQQNSISKLSRSLSRTHFALSSIKLDNPAGLSLASVNVEFWVIVDKKDGTGAQPYFKIGNASTNALGNYQVPFLKSTFDALKSNLSALKKNHITSTSQAWKGTAANLGTNANVTAITALINDLVIATHNLADTNTAIDTTSLNQWLLLQVKLNDISTTKATTLKQTIETDLQNFDISFSPLSNDVDSLYTSKTYKIQMSLSRPSINGTQSINSKVAFQPSYNGKALGNAKASAKNRLSIKAQVDFSSNQAIRLEISNPNEYSYSDNGQLVSWEENIENLLEPLKSKVLSQQTLDATEQSKFNLYNKLKSNPELMKERLIVQQGIDTNGDGLQNESTPLVVVSKPEVVSPNGITIEPKVQLNANDAAVVTIYEVDADSNGQFAEGNDLVAPSALGGSTNEETKIASFVDISGASKPSDKVTVQQQDTQVPQIFFQPLSNQGIVQDKLELLLSFSDNLAYNLSTLKVFSSNEAVAFPPPLNRVIKVGVNFAELFQRDSTVSGGTAKYTFTRPITSFPNGLVHTLNASIEDFAGNKGTAVISFKINREPRITAPSQFNVSETAEGISTSISFSVEDIPPLALTMCSFSGLQIPNSISLSINAKQCSPQPLQTECNETELSNTNSQLIYASRNSSNTCLSIQNLYPTIKDQSLNPTITVTPGHNFALDLGGPRPFELAASDSTGNLAQSQILTIVPTKNNTLPASSSKFCWSKGHLDNTTGFAVNNLSSLSQVCKFLTGAENQLNAPTGCDTNFNSSSTGNPCYCSDSFQVAENTTSTFVFCSSDLDFENEVSLNFTSVQRTIGDTSPKTLDSTILHPFNSPKNIGFRYYPLENSVLPASLPTASSISVFDWKPNPLSNGGTNILTFTFQDGIGNLQSTELTLIVSTVEDAPILTQLNGNLAASDGDILTTPLNISEASLADYLNTQNDKPLFSIKQGNSVQLTFNSTDDERQLVNGTVPYLKLLNSSQFNVKIADWLQRPSNPTQNVTMLDLVGKSQNRDSLIVTQYIIIETADSIARPTTYTIPFEIIDQNDDPVVSTVANDLTLSVQNSFSSSGSKIVTIFYPNIVPEDSTVDLYLHALDIDPSKNSDQVTTGICYQPNFTFSDDTSYGSERTKLVNKGSSLNSEVWTQHLSFSPTTQDTNEGAGNATNKESLFTLKVISGNTNHCKRTETVVHLKVNVSPVDEAPYFKNILVDNNVDIDDGKSLPTDIFTIYQGKPFEFKQFIEDEELHTITDVILSNPNPDLSLGLTFYQNQDTSKPSFFTLSSTLNNQDILPYVNGLPQISTLEYTTRNSILATGLSTSRSESLSFRLSDTADAPKFVNVNTGVTITDIPPIVNMTEDVPGSFLVRASNDSEKNPLFKNKFSFKLISAPMGVSLSSSLLASAPTIGSASAQLGVTAIISWTPSQNDVSGANTKTHNIDIQTCVSEAIEQPTTQTCKIQTYRIQVSPVDDLADIYYGVDTNGLGGTLLTSTSFGINNPFTIQEDSDFVNRFLAKDIDGEDVSSLKVELLYQGENYTANGYSIKKQANTNFTRNKSLTALSVSNTKQVSQLNNGEELFSPTSIPQSDPNTIVMLQDVYWKSIDWDDISTSPQALTTSSYVLRLQAVSNGQTKEVSMFLKLVSTNDSPIITNLKFASEIGQKDPAGTRVQDLTQLVYNEENDALSYQVKGPDTEIFLSTNIESTGNSRYVTLSLSPGSNQVGPHAIVLSVNEVSNPENNDSKSVSFIVTDSNDILVFNNDSIFNTTKVLSEGEMWATTIRVIDRDLQSTALVAPPLGERITYNLVGSLSTSFSDSSTRLFYSTNSMLSLAHPNYTTPSLTSTGTNHSTSGNIIFTGLNVPRVLQTNNALNEIATMNFSFAALKVTTADSGVNDPFANFNYYLHVQAMDHFKSDRATVRQTIAILVKPVDNKPAIQFVSNEKVHPLSSSFPVKFTSSVSLVNSGLSLNPIETLLLPYIIKEDSTAFTFSVTAFDQESEAINYSYVQSNLSTASTATLTNLTSISISTFEATSSNSLKMSFSPTNINVGHNSFTLQIADLESPIPTSVNRVQSNTAQLNLLIANVADQPFLTKMSSSNLKSKTQTSVNIHTLSTNAIIIYEDEINHILFSIDDQDLHIPKGFSTQSKASVMAAYNTTSTTAILSLERLLMPAEFFRYQLATNASETFDGLTIFEGSSQNYNLVTNTPLYRYALSAQVPTTSTSNLVSLSWVPSLTYTFDYRLDNSKSETIPLTFFVDSFASKSIDSSKKTSLTTTIKVLVWPRNDTPTITSEKLEYDFNEDQTHTITFTLNDEEEANNLSLHFAPLSTHPSGMEIIGNKIQWTPDNSHTVLSSYKVSLVASDTGKITPTSVSDPRLTATTALQSTSYTVTIQLKDQDDNAQQDTTYIPAITAVEDQAYKTYIRYTDIDPGDKLQYSILSGSPAGMQITSAPTEHDDIGNTDMVGIINWTPTLPGQYPVRVGITSVVSKTGLIKTTLEYAYNIQVSSVNDKPRFISPAPSNIVENEYFSYTPVVDDEDNEIIFLSYDTTAPCTLPSFMQLESNSLELSGFTTLTGLETLENSFGDSNEVPTTAAVIDNGFSYYPKFHICLTLSDGVNPLVTQAFDLTMTRKNNTPSVEKLVVLTNPPSVLSSNRTTQLTSVILKDKNNQPGVYTNATSRLVKLYQKSGFVNKIQLTIHDEELDGPLLVSAESIPTGVSIINPTPSLDASGYTTVDLTWLADPSVSNTQQTFVLRLKDSKGAFKDFSFIASVSDEPDKPVIQSAIASNELIFTTEDILNTQVNLFSLDSDTNSLVTYSIVTSEATMPHPTEIIRDSNPEQNSSYILNLNNSGAVTFKATTAPSSVPKLVPVTFSICGSPRETGFSSDCITVRYNYRLIFVNDDPIFTPALAPSSKVTASEGSNYGGLVFRKALKSSECMPAESLEICIYDEESTTLTDLANLKLEIVDPEVFPNGLSLSQPFLSNGNSYIQTVLWTNIPFNESPARNLRLHAYEATQPSKLATFTYTVDIANINVAPVINNNFPLLKETILEGSTFLYNLGAITNDSDNDPLRYNLLQSVSGMTINTESGLISWIPNTSHLGLHLIQVSVIDQPFSTQPTRVTTNLYIDVKKVNNPPVISPVLRKVFDSSQTTSPIATEAQLFEAKVFAFDEEGDSFSFIPSASKLNGEAFPSNFSFSAVGKINWIPTNSEVGPNQLLVVAQDTKSGLNATAYFTLTVNNRNDPPSFANPISTAQTINESDSYVRQFNVNDQDPSETHVFGAVVVPPTLEASINASGLLTILTKENSVGTYNVSVSVTDSGFLTDTNNFSLEVIDTNNPPTLLPVPELYVEKTKAYNHQLQAIDPEGDLVTYETEALPSDRAQEVQLGLSTGLLNITYNNNPDPFSFTIKAKDSTGQYALATRAVNIIYTDSVPPKIVSSPPKTGKILTQYEYNIVTEPTAGTEIEAVNLPPGMEVNGSKLTWVPKYSLQQRVNQAGTHQVIIRARQNIDGEIVKSKPQNYYIEISDSNNSPVSNYLKNEVTNEEKTNFASVEGLEFEYTILKITDVDIEDFGRLHACFDIGIVEPCDEQNGTKNATSNADSKSQASLTITTKVVLDNKVQLFIGLKWTPDNAAAEGENSFSIYASDGIDKSNVLTVTFNVSNTNNSPDFYQDENLILQETAYMGQTYKRSFYARDLDRETAWFCLDKEKFTKPTNPNLESAANYPGFAPQVGIPFSQQDQSKVRVQLVGENDIFYSKNEISSLPDSVFCVKGTPIVLDNDPHPERGKLSKIDFYYYPLDRHFAISQRPGLPLILTENLTLENENEPPTFLLQLAPTISSIMPQAQFEEGLVYLTGEGVIIQGSLPLTVKFLNSQKEVTATTTVRNLGVIDGFGEFIVPKGAESGFISVGFSTYSSAVPFTVLKGESSVIAGNTETDEANFSASSGLAVTWVNDNLFAMVSNAEYHTINLYKFDNSGKQQNFYINQQYQPYLQISGQLGQHGDSNTVPRLLDFPTGLSIAYNKTSTYVLVADTNNNKIKAINISDLWSTKKETDYDFPHYTIAKSSHLNRPYKAIQKSPNSTNIFIANTFNNTIELLDVGVRDFKVLENFPFKSNIDGLDGSQNTKTSTGTGYARVDNLGNLFHPIDMAFNDDKSTLWVSNYTNHEYSLNSSFHLYTGEWIDKNDFSGTGQQYTESNQFYSKNISLGNLSNESNIPGNQQNIITLSNSNLNTQITSEGLMLPHRSEEVLLQLYPSLANPKITNQVSYLMVNEKGLNKTPFDLWTNEMTDFKKYYQATNNLNTVSNLNMSYQTGVLDFPTGISDSGSTRINASAKASLMLQPASQELIVSPQHDLRSTYSLTNLEKSEFPKLLQTHTLGDPFYYDTNQDHIPDLFVPDQLYGKIYIFPGKSSSEPSVPPLTFDFANSWYIDNSSFGQDCVNQQCLVGVRHVNTGRFIGSAKDDSTGIEVEKATRGTLRGDDLVLVNSLKSIVYVLDSYGFSVHQDSVAGGFIRTNHPQPIIGMSDFNFHINQKPHTDWFNDTPAVTKDDNTYFTNPSAFPGTLVEFVANNSPYSFTAVTLDQSPHRVVSGHFTSKYLGQTCYNSACLDVTHCQNGFECGVQSNFSDSIDNVTYAWSAGVTNNLSAGSLASQGFTSLTVDLLNLEQMILITTPESQTQISGMGILGFGSGHTPYTVDLGSFKASSKVYSGMIDSASSLSLAHMTWNTDGGVQRWGSQSFGGERARQDGIIFVDEAGKFQYKIITDSNFQTEQAISDVYAESTDLSKCGKTSDFRVIDFTGDQISDLIALHPDTNTVSMHVGTGNKSESQFYTGTTTCDDLGTNVQVLPTLDKPVSIDVLDSTRLSGNGFSNPEFIISYANSQSISVYTSSADDKLYFSYPTHFNMGVSGIESIKTVHRTDKIHTTVGSAPVTFEDYNSNNSALAVTSGLDIWSGYYYGAPNTSDQYYLTGVKESEIATAGILFAQSLPNESQGSVGAMTMEKEWIFRSTRSYFVSTEGLNLYNATLNNDTSDDLVTSDPYNHVFNILFSSPSQNAILFDPNSKTYHTEGLIGGMAFGDINQDVRDDINNKAYDDIIVSNFADDSITIFHNGGRSSNSTLNPDFTFSHSGYPPTTVSVGNGPKGVTMADFDGNGYKDIAVSNYIGGNVSVLFNQGTIPPTFKSILLPAGLAPSHIFAVDLEKSITEQATSTDIVVVNRDSNDVYVFKNNGKGKFSSPYIHSISDYFPTERSLKNSSTGLFVDPNAEKVQDFLYGNIGSQGLTSSSTYNSFLIGKAYGINTLINTGNKSSSEYHTGISSYTVNTDGSLSFVSTKKLDASSAIKSIAFVDQNLYFGSAKYSNALSNPFLSNNGSSHSTATLHRWNLSSTLGAAPLTAPVVSESSFFDLKKDQLGGVIEALATVKKPGSSTKELYYIHSGKQKTLQRILPSAQSLISGAKKSPTSTNIDTLFGKEFSFNHPAGLTLDDTKNTLLVADSSNNLVRIVDLESNVTRTLVVGSTNDYVKLTGVIDLVKENNTFNYFALFPNPGAALNKGLGLIKPSDDPNASFSFITLNDEGAGITPANWFQIIRHGQYLYIAENSSLINPNNGNIYEIDTADSPFTINKVTFKDGYTLKGLSGITLSSDGSKLFLSEYQSNTIKMANLIRDTNTQSMTNLTITTLAGFDNISGHYDGSTSLALLSRPRALSLNKNEDSLYFIDGSTIRYINLENLSNGLSLEVNTIAGNPFQTGIINGSGTRSRFLAPYYLQYRNLNGVDILYISDYLGNNIREFRP